MELHLLELIHLLSWEQTWKWMAPLGCRGLHGLSFRAMPSVPGSVHTWIRMVFLSMVHSSNLSSKPALVLGEIPKTLHIYIYLNIEYYLTYFMMFIIV